MASMILLPFFRTLRTIAYLRPGQVIGQLRVRVRRRVENPARIARREAPPWPGVRWRPRVAWWLAPTPEHNAPEGIVGGTLTFLNETHRIEWLAGSDVMEDGVIRKPTLPRTWGQVSKLWRYHEHYLDYLWALDYEPAKELVARWITHYRPARGMDGWEPYPISLRLMNLAALFFGRYAERTAADHEFRNQLWRSMFHQAMWLASHLETHLMGNHLLENGFALATVGACFEGDAATTWRRRGLTILERELTEQVLGDGCHFERSPMYQLRVTYALAMVVNTGEVEYAEKFAPVLERMIRAVELLRHGDRETSRFNDSALEVYPAPDEVARFGGEVGGQGREHGVAGAESAKPRLVYHATPRMAEGVRRGVEDSATATHRHDPSNFTLPDAGYFGAHTQARDTLICDAGPVGPDYIPGHAHGDIFSFELSFSGRPVIVDSGTFDYVPGEMRRYCRSTAAHNTVTINGEDQCEFWSAFRVGRRGRPHEVKYEPLADGFRLAGWHDGYRHLPGGPVHHRRFRWHDAGVLLIEDRITSGKGVQAVSRLHLHPDCVIVRMDERSAVVQYGLGEDQLIHIAFAGEGRLRRETGWYCPRFGERHESQVLCWEVSSGEGVWMMCISRVGEAGDMSGERGVVIGGKAFGW